MKRLFSKLFKKHQTPVYHINYSDKTEWSGSNGRLFFYIGTIRNNSSQIIGQFFYMPTKDFGIVCPRDKNKKYYIPKDKNSPWAVVDAYIDPIVGALNKIDSLQEFLKVEFGL